MNLTKGYKRILIVLAVAWSPIALYSAAQDLPGPYREREREIANRLAREFLLQHPDPAARSKILGETQKMLAGSQAPTETPAAAGGMVFGSTQTASPMTPEELAELIELNWVIHENGSIRRQAWMEAHEAALATLAKFLVAPLLGLIVFYFLSISVARWITAGFTSRP